ncbi:gluconokinase [Rhizosaccharibacter radicis]|uniref:Gluconokinase n=1 Tax=Rhizosaccharibacter radicis TaxID=2782605 RepID=A0ABT1VUD4_9PROT|nr:gluconokinase [Acetobacteraceae bacterium KSS12]
MGVSGSGKSTVALQLHERLGWPFQEGDDLHPPENVAKMSASIPLTDEDRKPWLARCARWVRQHQEADGGGILTCSALKRAYRNQLVDHMPGVFFLYLKVPEAVLRARMAHRKGHYMPAGLLPSQLQTLEEPADDEPVIRVQVADTADATVEAALSALRASG